MPKISIIIPAYNVGSYLAECLESVSAQTFNDFEAIVVNDASTDDTGEIAAKAAAKDSRITVVANSTNKGTHLTRMAGVEHATGDYTFFLDGDDALKPDMCEQLAVEMDDHPVDILHYGLTVVGANELLQSELQAFELFNNAPTPDSDGEDIVRDIFDESRGNTVDWRVTQRLYRTSLLKRAFSLMTRARLGRSQDGYECFVVSALAESYHSYKQCRGYIYYYGRGISGTNMISADKYSRYCEHFKADFNASYQFAKAQHSSMLHTCAVGFEHKATEILANDWRVRVPAEQKIEAAQYMASIMGGAVAAREIWRHVRDLAWSLLSGKADDKAALSNVKVWNEIARQVYDGQGDFDQLKRCRIMRLRAQAHINELTCPPPDLSQYDNQPIRIFVTTHKNVVVPESRILQPVQVGLTAGSERFSWAFHDDEGENISAKNPVYCELTTQYWAWKNIDAEYYGFCHYRRYFDFSEVEHKENDFGEIMDDYINGVSINRYGLNDETIAQSVHGYDVITTRFGDLQKIINNYGTPRAIWEHADALHDDDLQRCYEILCRMHPDYKQDADAFLDGSRSCFCNMFIMKKAIFFDYCEWLFPILKEFEEEVDMSHYSREALRTPGHLSERLLNIYLMHHERVGAPWKTKELQTVHFTHPEPQWGLEPLWDYVKGASNPVPVVFAADNNYVPQLTTTIYSAMKNASTSRYYDVIVLQHDIDWRKQERMIRFFQQFANMTLRFVDVEHYIAGYELSTNNEHISVETYYRFLIQQALPFYDKVLYLDSDIVVNGDIADLYDTDLTGNLIAAVRDIDFLANLNVKHGKRMGYAKNVLRMKNPYDYFQAGVLVLNTRAMRDWCSIEQWLTYASNPDYIYNDQDVLNIHCEGRVKYLDWDWNVVHDCDGRVDRLFVQAPASAFEAYCKSRNHPKIIHYAGFQKPWSEPKCDFAELYWQYARATPFYEELIPRPQVIQQIIQAAPASQLLRHERAISATSSLRRIVDPVAPVGSARREVLKSLGRFFRGRK